MNDSTQDISPLRQRMIEDMRMRKLAPHTQSVLRACSSTAGGLFAPSARYRHGRGSAQLPVAPG